MPKVWTEIIPSLENKPNLRVWVQRTLLLFCTLDLFKVKDLL